MVSGGAPDWRVWLIDSPGSQLRPRAWASRKRLLTAGEAHLAAEFGKRRHGPAAARGPGCQPGCACLQDRLRSPGPGRRRRLRSLGGGRPSRVRGPVSDPTGAAGALRGVRRPLARQSTGRPKGSLPPGAGPNQGGRGSNGPPEKLWRWGEERVSFGGRPPKRGGKRAARNCRSQPSALTHVSAGLAAASFSSPTRTRTWNKLVNSRNANDHNRFTEKNLRRFIPVTCTPACTRSANRPRIGPRCRVVA
jgi:hypothetical protein